MLYVIGTIYFQVVIPFLRLLTHSEFVNSVFFEQVNVVFATIHSQASFEVVSFS
jgi:hypothetical protein